MEQSIVSVLIIKVPQFSVKFVYLKGYILYTELNSEVCRLKPYVDVLQGIFLQIRQIVNPFPIRSLLINIMQILALAKIEVLNFKQLKCSRH